MSTPPPREFRLKSRRFQIVRVLGQGGMGVVYEARDRERDATVALKMLRSIGAQARVRLKREFRALQGIHHPNLVSLGELFEEEGEVFFTMELVQGEDFIEHVRPSAPRSPRAIPAAIEADDLETRAAGASPTGTTPAPPTWHWLERRGERFDEARLRAAFLKLARGIEALHAAEKIHRDIKPSNVLVTAGGRVVILDFGVVLDATLGEREGAVVGTAHFMAPEQAAGGHVGPEADWYSVGAMLYLALTGFFPFQLAPEVALDFKQAVEPTRPSLVATEAIPLDLEELCVELLRLDPSARPAGAEVRRRLEEVRASSEPPPSSRSSGFVGRAGELAQLRDALASARAGAAVSILVEGESGMGKSALVRRFLASIEGEALVLAGRCYERESVPYKGVDEIGEALGRWIAGLPAERVTALLPPNAELLGDLFPALRLATPRGRSSRPSAPISSSRAARDAADPRRARALVFAALREMLTRIAREQPLVVAIDDLQWADVDGLALLDAILQPPDAPPLLFIATLRRDADARADAGPTLVGPVRKLTVGRLPRGEARELISLLLGAAAVAGHPEVVDVDALAEEGGGHPLFLDALVRHRLSQSGDVGLVRLDDALRARIERLDPPARQLLDVVAIAGRPIPARIAAQAAEVASADLSPALAALRADNLASTAGIGPGQTVEPFHDRVREAVLGAIDAPRRRALHLRLALGLEAWGGADLEALTLHFRDAGDVERGSEYAARAGDQAAAALAFDRAAELYRAAHALFPRDRAERRDLLIKLGDALANSGRGAQAAEAYLGASRAAEADLGLELRRRAADSLIRAGHIDEGVAGLAAVMDAVGLGVAATRARALASLIFRRAQLGLRGISFRERAASEISARELTRVDVSYSAASSVSLIDVTRGVAWQSRHLLLALDAGEPSRVARALALEACVVACEGPAAAARVAEVLAAATAAAARAADPHSLGLIEGTVGMSHFLAGRFRPALAALDRAEVIFRDRGGVVWERALAVVHAIWALWLLGDAPELLRRIPLLARESETRGDRYVALYLRANVGNASWLLLDQPDEAERQIDLACSGWTGTTFDVHGLCELVARVSLDLYRGDGASAHRRVLEGKAVFARTSATRIQIVLISLQHLAGRAALAAAPSGRESAALLAAAASAAARIERARADWALPLADLLRAGVASARGDRGTAITTLDRAIRGFHAADLALYDAAARRRLGALLGGDDGATMVRKATTWMEAQGVVSPAKLTALLAPGFTA
ncbi:MAG: AAA family ATPase [Byssovorax sp.]